MGKNITWEIVSFTESKAPKCEITFRPNAQMVFSVETLEALRYPRIVQLLHSPANDLVALKSAEDADVNTISLTASELPQGKPRTISARKAYRWICDLLKQEEEVLIKLPGVPDAEGMIVFDLKKASIAPKRTRKAKNTAEG